MEGIISESNRKLSTIKWCSYASHGNVTYLCQPLSPCNPYFGVHVAKAHLDWNSEDQRTHEPSEDSIELSNVLFGQGIVKVSDKVGEIDIECIVHQSNNE